MARWGGADAEPRGAGRAGCCRTLRRPTGCEIGGRWVSGAVRCGPRRESRFAVGMAYQSPRGAARTSSLTLSVASPAPSAHRGATPRAMGAVLPADRSAASRRELDEILAQLDSPRGGGGYDSPRGRQPVTAGGSLNESTVASTRPSISSQFPVQTTSPMSVLNAGSSKTISQVMQEHSYASPRAAQAGARRSTSASYSSPYSSSRGLVGAHRSLTPPPSQGELEDLGNELKHMLATPVQTPRRELLNIQPPERPEPQLDFTQPRPQPEPEPEHEREPLEVRSVSSIA